MPNLGKVYLFKIEGRVEFDVVIIRGKSKDIKWPNKDFSQMKYSIKTLNRSASSNSSIKIIKLLKKIFVDIFKNFNYLLTMTPGLLKQISVYQD